MKMYHVSDFETLFQGLDNCESDVVLTLEDGCRYSWKTDGNLFRSLARSMQTPELRELELSASAADSQRLVSHMVYSQL